jgi:citrate lyase subunit beta/citryl-CoA lyase
MLPRSYLFVPASRPDRYERALASGADAVIVDLEDAVAAAHKPAARESLQRWLSSRPHDAPAITVRINAAGTPWHDADLALATQSGVAALMVPKGERTALLSTVAARRDGLGVIALIESARGIAAAREIAAAPGVTRLAFGSIDLALDLGLRNAVEDDLAPYRAELVLASRLAGLPAPVDGVTAAIDDAALLVADVQRARRLGFGAKLCIHPRQVRAVHQGLAPAPPEVAWARRIVEAAGSAGGGAVAVDGTMVDAPVLERARTILRDAQAPASGR